jgi:hypothetical protein
MRTLTTPTMRARIRSGLSPTQGLTPKRDYLVLAITIDARPAFPARSTLVLLGDDGFPTMLPSTDAEIVDATIPARWRVDASSGHVSIGPPAMNRGDFWEQFWDNRGPDDDGRWVQPIYRDEARSLVAEMGTRPDHRAVDEMPAWEEPRPQAG